MDKLVLPTGTRQDRAEDVFGGLDAMLSLSWQRVGTKVGILNRSFSSPVVVLISLIHRYLFTWRMLRAMACNITTQASMMTTQKEILGVVTWMI